MATAFTPHHSHAGIQFVPATRAIKTRKPSAFARFLRDLFEDLAQKPLQDARFAKHDMFREHINAMSISYFALIVLLLAASVPAIATFLPILIQN